MNTLPIEILPQIGIFLSGDDLKSFLEVTERCLAEDVISRHKAELNEIFRQAIDFLTPQQPARVKPDIQNITTENRNEKEAEIKKILAEEYKLEIRQKQQEKPMVRWPLLIESLPVLVDINQLNALNGKRIKEVLFDTWLSEYVQYALKHSISNLLAFAKCNPTRGSNYLHAFIQGAAEQGRWGDCLKVITSMQSTLDPEEEYGVLALAKAKKKDYEGAAAFAKKADHNGVINVCRQLVQNLEIDKATQVLRDHCASVEKDYLTSYYIQFNKILLEHGKLSEAIAFAENLPKEAAGRCFYAIVMHLILQKDLTRIKDLLSKVDYLQGCVDWILEMKLTDEENLALFEPLKTHDEAKPVIFRALHPIYVRQERFDEAFASIEYLGNTVTQECMMRELLDKLFEKGLFEKAKIVCSKIPDVYNQARAHIRRYDLLLTLRMFEAAEKVVNEIQNPDVRESFNRQLNGSY